jgi:Putative amidoligase enzyme
MRNRAFGVELEFDSNGLDMDGVARVLRNEFDRRGMRRWYFRDRMDYDGSEIELKTPILRGPKGFKTLEVVMNTLSENGCFTTENDGLHVHHDAPEFVNNIDNCIRIVKSWRANRHLIYQFVARDRVYDNWSGEEGRYWACPAWTDQSINDLERTRELVHYYRNDLNLCSLPYKGSIEIRLHEGTLDYQEAKSWIMFGQSFINRTLKHSMRDSKDVTNLLKKVQISPNAQRVLIDKTRYRREYAPEEY